MEKLVVIPDRVSAFSKKVGSVVIGKTVDLETLVDMDKLLRIAKVKYDRIQYLGGLFIFIVFMDSEAADKFLGASEVWGPWFSKLEAWGGHILPMERVAWLSLHGINVNLLDHEVLVQIGELFGKVLFAPNELGVDSDLSVFKIGVLAGEVHRISDVVSLKWKDKTFRIWVDEDQDPWVPDCLNRSEWSTSVDNSPVMSSPVCAQEKSGEESVGWSQKLDGEKEDEQPAVNVGAPLEGDIPMHEDLEHVVNQSDTTDLAKGESVVGPNRESPIGDSNSNDVGPFPFGSGAGVGFFGLGGLTSDKSPGAFRRSRVGSRHKKGQAHEGKIPSPDVARPRKKI
ncbi:hypothetical protein HanRHA438_Chr13g0613941 [Helianthus annuus]|uniref:DUF4283 domain-containing protein n=1 Tax=Helianthus annuus TaxID=4232 RepID=A0A9K3EIX7_HELAN|nr:hypothetical protein HanXRQr2_Chr13g0603421 [Helianthus annuus]KAJ0477978.1 hypothetical protein HanHA300_Chr13g0494991 [Helianthus annuus]KAJ0498831.1 hypothetical protein HanHA89_Chr13g0527401 [Helianthus annuus]KAJ0664850.1 hypothetical protein HanLR1_Chr13g0497471 [Helianthus annuus]KAJ0672287.1 hypothetical protein HanOQP8_Chr13g0495621 [Helianthus annuus]